MRTIQMSDYTVGEDCFEAIPRILAQYGAKKVVLVGGENALAAASPEIIEVLNAADILVLDTIVYGKDSTQTNVDKLAGDPNFRDADVAFAIGGGKAIDTVKTAALSLEKTVFSVPTICSNCSAATAIAVIYNDDGSLDRYAYPNAPAHIFINPKVIAEAPAMYFWAGIGDALSKQPEVEYATSDGNLTHTAELGLSLAHTCTEPLMTYGEQGLADVRADTSSEAVRRIALDILVNTGYVSNLTNQPDFYYNSSLAHAFYNATTGVEREGRTHLHGEVVSFGVLVLFAYAGDTAELERYARFNRALGLPVTLAELDLDESHLSRIAELAQNTNEWRQANPQPFDSARFIEAIRAADAFGRTLA
ncbi:MAG: iron-containing alcohol dehydrogenase family protein [Coriobacteriaceae bacterium]|nr:iron-containing alcohol dehydrogenase family protein [Coriobacteriaceae bacterium]